MPHSVTLITTIAVSFGLALLMGLIANRLKLPVLVGYLAQVSFWVPIRRASWPTWNCRANWRKSA